MFYLEEGIDDQSFQLINEETIKILFDKAGPRLIFTRNYFDRFPPVTTCLSMSDYIYEIVHIRIYYYNALLSMT